MQRRITFVGVIYLLLSICWSGCDQLIHKPNQTSVNIMVAVNIQFLDADNSIIQKTSDGMKVNIEITRNGHDRLMFERIMQNELCQATGNFDLTEGSYIEWTASIKNEYQQYHQVFPGYAKLTWDTVYSSTNFGNVYNWYPKITIMIKV